MRVPVPSFKSAPSDAVEFEGWRLVTDDDTVDLPNALEHWSYQTVLSLTGEIDIARCALLEACDLATDSELAIAVRVRSDVTGITRVVYFMPLPPTGECRTTVRFELPGQELAGRLYLETLVVATDPKPLTPVAARVRGSILWSGRQATELQGIGSQFPTDAVDFEQWGRPNRSAGWELQIDLSDPEALFHSAVRLTLNTSRTDIVRLLEGDRSEKIQLLRRTLHWDVTRQLVSAALGHDEVVGAEFDPGARTVSGVLRNLLSMVWPDVPVATLQRWLIDDPSRIETYLQQHCKLLS